MSFGYYLLFKPLAKALPAEMLPVCLNILGSVAAVLLLIPLFFMTESLFSSRTAFFTCLFLIFTPNYWLLTRSGHPLIFALLLFITGLAAFEKYTSRAREKSWLLGATSLLMVGALLMRVDFLLWIFSFLGLLLVKKRLNRRVIFLLFLFALFVIGGYLFLKWSFFGFIFRPGEEAIPADILSWFSGFGTMMNTVLKNSGRFLLGVLPVVAICFILSLLHLIRAGNWRLLGFVALWASPALVFVLLAGRSFGRLIIPALFPLFMVMADWMDGILNRYKHIIPLSLLFFAHLLPFLYSPIVGRIYSSRIVFEGRPVHSVPAAPLLTYFGHKRKYLLSVQDVVERVIQNRKNNVVIITDSTHSPWYLYKLVVDRRADCYTSPGYVDSLPLHSCQTGENCFSIFVIRHQKELARAKEKLSMKEYERALFHIPPFIQDLAGEDLFFDKAEIQKRLEITRFSRRKEI